MDDNIIATESDILTVSWETYDPLPSHMTLELGPHQLKKKNTRE